MKRILLLLPDVDVAKRIVDDLLIARLREEEMHVVAKEGVPLMDLPEATLAQKTDLIPSIKRGVAAGGATGLLAGLIAITVPGGITVAGGAVLLASTLVGTAFGAWISSMIGISVPSHEVEEYEQAIEQGKLLMMVDIPKARADEIIAMIRQHDPEANIKEVEYFPPLLPEMSDK